MRLWIGATEYTYAIILAYWWGHWRHVSKVLWYK